jgi:hypothetical protein
MAGLLAAGRTAAIATDTGIKAAAQQLERQLQARLAGWRAVHRNAEPAQAWLEGRIAFSDEAQKAELEARKRELDRKAREAERCIAQARAVIAALADRSTRNAIAAPEASAREPA